MAALEIIERKTVDAKFLRVDAEVRYWEDATVNGQSDEDGALIPFRVGDAWRPIIDIDRGTMKDWPSGTVASVHYKVCDAGVYTLVGEDGTELVRKDGYVPGIMSPGGDGYGDYIIMAIGEDGQIANWRADLSDFEAKDEDPNQ